MNGFNGLGLHLGNLSRLSSAKTRSISAENPDGSKAGGARAVPAMDESGKPTGPARELGVGYKVRPNDIISPGEEKELGHIHGSGAIQSIWMTMTGTNRYLILRVYWDDQELPSVECPVSDFFASPWAGCHVYPWDGDDRLFDFARINSLAVGVNPGSAYSCFWEMPFRKSARVTMENIGFEDSTVYWQINYTLTDVPEDAAYFHAQFRSSTPVADSAVHTLLDGIEGRGHYVGTSIGWQVNHGGWWGEGEIKFYLDGDTDPALSDGREIAGSTGFPTICGTGVEDYFLGSWNFERRETQRYEEFTGPYSGMPQVVRPDGLYQSNQRFALYRWHIMDPVRFENDIKVTIHALGWKRKWRFYKRRDDISSVSYWYQTLPSPVFPILPGRDDLEII